MSGVVFDRVTKRFGDVTAVDSLSLEVVDKEFMVLLGPSGCGKSTALRMIAGLESVTEGSLRIGGAVVNDVEAKDRDIAMVFQSYALYPHMTVRQNIEVPLKTRSYAVDGAEARRLHKSERAARVEQTARSLGLDGLLARKPGALSGGQRQRVALARAIVRRPQVFLMDEPLSNLDAKLRAQTRVELVELHRQLQTTIVYVTHDQVEAMTMADRIAILDHGRLQQVGPPQAVYARPANLFVARFIGSPPMNTVPGTLRIHGSEAHVEIGSGRLAITPGDLLRDGLAVVAGIRPEHLRIGPGPLSASVRAIEWLGHERHVYCDVEEAVLVVRETDQVGERVRPGDRVTLTASPEVVHLFDADTTERLN
ncbi:MAG: ABC transporter ATP-binding protein [Actinomycetota bacterium]